MTERFPPDCSPVSGRFRNTTFICPGPSTASLRFALTPGLAPRLAPSAASLSLRASGHLARLLRSAALRARDRAVALSCSFGCSAVAPRLGSPRSTTPLRCAARSRSGWRPVWLLRLLRFASRLGSPRSTAPLRCAARSRPGSRPVWLLRLLRCRSAPRVTSLDCSAALRVRDRAGAPSGSFDCSAVLQRARACEISQATGLCYAGGRSGARFFLPAPSISDLSVKELASA